MLLMHANGVQLSNLCVLLQGLPGERQVAALGKIVIMHCLGDLGNDVIS